MPRAQNAHAHVNAGFLFKLDGAGKVLEKPNIIIGGINKDFVSKTTGLLSNVGLNQNWFFQLHALDTENFLIGKSILDKKVIKDALDKLDNELHPDHILPDYSPKFRKTLAEGLFFKVYFWMKTIKILSNWIFMSDQRCNIFCSIF